MPNESYKWNYKISLGQQNAWWRYFGEYHWLVNLVFDRAAESEVSVISRPMLFLIRHTLELGYKGNIVELEKVSGIKSETKLRGREGHNLECLHLDFERHFRAISKRYNVGTDILVQFDNLNSHLNKLKDVLHRLDSDSYAFRYPFKPGGRNPSFKQKEMLNMAEVKELFTTAIKLFKYTTDVIAEHIPPMSCA